MNIELTEDETEELITTLNIVIDDAEFISASLVNILNKLGGRGIEIAEGWTSLANKDDLWLVSDESI